MSPRWPTFIALLLLSGLLAGCGQKGPLYLPDAPVERETHTHTSAGAGSEAEAEAGAADDGEQTTDDEQTDPQADLP